MIKTIEKLVQIQKAIVILRAINADKIMRTIEVITKVGFQLIEISFATPNAAKIIAALNKLYANTHIIIGAGTVTDKTIAQQAYDSGAQFFVSPNTDIEVIQLAQQNSIYMVSGALTPTEIVNTTKLNVNMVKVFPINPIGGIDYIRAIKEPLPHVKIFASGGINLTNITQYLSHGAHAVGISNSIASTELIEKEAYDIIAHQAQQFFKKIMV